MGGRKAVAARKGKAKCNCWKYPNQVCDICQGVKANEDATITCPTCHGKGYIVTWDNVRGEIQQDKEVMTMPYDQRRPITGDKL